MDNGADAISTSGVYPANDSGNADRLLALFGPDFKHVEGVGWLRWRADLGCWRPDNKGPHYEAELCSRLIVRDGQKMGLDDLEKWGRTSGNAARISAAVEILSHRPDVAVEAAALDANPWLFNCANGTIDLRTGELRPHRREDLITKRSPVVYAPGEVAAAPSCPRFMQFLSECMAGDDELVAYLLRFLGYCLTGDVREHVLGLWHGGGRNGKSTLLEVMATVMGDYAVAVAPDLLLDTATQQHSTGLTDLRGARLATTVEPPAGRRWNESLVKQLTGGDRITARRMRQDSITWAPSHKLIMACNGRPIVRDQGRAFWARLHAVPWGVSFEGREDRELRGKLEAEASGILGMLVLGCRAWQAHGLCPPTSMSEARDEYKESQDTIGQFVAERLVESRDGFLPRAQLYADYREWATTGGEHLLPASVFYRHLDERRWDSAKRHGVRGYLGWSIRQMSPLGVVRAQS
jgi:putative DNA primase/helicase